MHPHQCLGSVWSRRDKSRDRDAASVLATIEQFNAVSYRVISTVLMEPDAKSSSRAKVISKWVDIAQVSKLVHSNFPPFLKLALLCYLLLPRRSQVWVARTTSLVYHRCHFKTIETN